MTIMWTMMQYTYADMVILCRTYGFVDYRIAEKLH